MNGGNDTEEHEEGDVDDESAEEDGTSAEPGGKRPREGVGHELEAGVDEVEHEGLVVADSSLCR